MNKRKVKMGLKILVGFTSVCIFLAIVRRQWTYVYQVNRLQRYFVQDTVRHVRNYTILWSKTPFFIDIRPDAKYCGFDACQFSNCRMTFNISDAKTSDAVIFDGRFVGPRLAFKRPIGQVWIFSEHESPLLYGSGPWKRLPWVRSFNWTMTYDKSNTDIYLPFGEIRKRPTLAIRNYTDIASNKSNDILMISSHCPTSSGRESFVSKLREHINVTILGKCGEKWNCGKRLVHNDCFQILNKYRFYLAFENAFCHQYFTEKYFSNFNYNTILVTRGGRKGDASNVFPYGTYISTDDFNSIESLAKYLRYMSGSVDKYAEMLKRKDQFYSVSYKSVYQRAMCDICKRMNNQDKYRKTIPDMYNDAFAKKPCRKPDDIK